MGCGWSKVTFNFPVAFNDCFLKDKTCFSTHLFVFLIFLQLIQYCQVKKKIHKDTKNYRYHYEDTGQKVNFVFQNSSQNS
jgi:hypothetical protein